MAKTRKNKGRRPARREVAPLEGNRIRIRTKRLDQVDEEKISLAFWLLAKQLVSDETDTRELTEDEVRREADKLDSPAQPGASS